MNNTIYSHVPTSEDLLISIRNAIPSYITGKRLMHTYSVEKESLILAKIFFPHFGIDKKYLRDISASALLHDITKYMPLEEQLSLCEKYGISVDDYSKDSAAVLHSKTAAFLARRDFGINDIVFSAIFNHTTGTENMNIFDKIIFIADFIEETRSVDSCIAARKYFYENIKKENDKIKVLDTTIIMSLDSTLSYLIKSDSFIDSDTIKARNFLLAEYALHS